MQQTNQILSPCLWYDGKAEEAAEFYVSVFPNSRIDKVLKSPCDWPAGKAGDAILVSFTLAGMQYQALNGGPNEPFNNSVSLSITCENQAEVDHYWEALTAGGGQPVQCGWLTDKYGLRWQVVPRALMRMMHDDDPEKAGRVMQAMMQMVKLDIGELERAYAEMTQ
jgi:predicted 3-demethylubiquinone-9 3-methyltransferase (glyoxalase superfamily)